MKKWNKIRGPKTLAGSTHEKIFFGNLNVPAITFSPHVVDDVIPTLLVSTECVLRISMCKNLLWGRFIFKTWKRVVEDGVLLRRRFQRVSTRGGHLPWKIDGQFPNTPSTDSMLMALPYLMVFTVQEKLAWMLNQVSIFSVACPDTTRIWND